MRFHENKHISFFILVGYVLVAFFAVKFFFSTVFPWTIPLIISLIIVGIIEKPVSFLERQKVPRKIAAAVCTFLCITVFSTVIYLIVTVCIVQGRELAAYLPSLIKSLSENLDALALKMDRFFSILPLKKIGFDISGFDDMLSKITLPNFSASTIVNPIFKVAVSLPTVIISVVFIFVSTYFITGERRTIVSFVKKQLPPKTLEVLLEIRSFLFSSVFKWIKAQSVIICITFCELLIGFALMKLSWAFLLAMLIAIIDALPILGVGTVLIPWSIISLIMGNYVKALGLIILYGVVLVVRNCVEPKIVGMHIGLHPFVSLLSVYFGYRIAGFGGMFLVPFAVILLCKLQELGVIKFYKE